MSKERSRNFHQKFEETPSEFEEQVVEIDRVSRTVKGGKRLRFRALVVVGNRSGKVGIGVAKAKEVIIAINKASVLAKKRLINVPIEKESIPHIVTSSFGSSRIILKPARLGTSVVAGGAVRVVLTLAGVKNVVGKILGSSSKINNAQATILALKSLQHHQSFDQPKEKEKDN